MKTNYVLKALWENDPVYYKRTLDFKIGDIPIRELTTSIKYATIFNSLEDVENELKLLNDSILKIFPICPICKNDYEEKPAISRIDNKTKICSKCGIQEAFDAYKKKED